MEVIPVSLLRIELKKKQELEYSMHGSEFASSIKKETLPMLSSSYRRVIEGMYIHPSS